DAGTLAMVGTTRLAERLPTLDEVHISSIGDGNPTISLNGLVPVAGATYVVRIGTHVYTSTVSTSLQGLAQDLETKIRANYGVERHGATVTEDWNSVLGELEWRIERGEAIAVTATVTPNNTSP